MNKDSKKRKASQCDPANADCVTIAVVARYLFMLSINFWLSLLQSVD